MVVFIDDKVEKEILHYSVLFRKAWTRHEEDRIYCDKT